ncbi:MAG: sialate O-acetylesterase, partial [Planctomycetota bacterium]
STERRPKMMTRLLLLVVALASTAVQGEPAFSPVFTSSMVLQRDQPIIIWGTGTPGETVTVTLSNRIGIDTPGPDGTWQVEMEPLPAGGPYRIAAGALSGSTTLLDVMIGDLWICSGQSNMFWRLEQTDRGGEFIERAEAFDGIRLFQVQRDWDTELRTTVETAGWQAASPETARVFSAVGFHFGRLVNEHTSVTVGLLQSAWGGTPAEAWTPMAALEAKPDVFADRLASIKQFRLPGAELERQLAAAQAVFAEFGERAWDLDVGEESGWAETEFDDSDWPELRLPGFIEGKLGAFDGIVWLRRTVELGPDWAGETGTLRLKRIDDYDRTFINGVEVGSTTMEDGDGRSIERAYDVPAGVLREGPNTVAIALMDVRSSGGVVPDRRRFRLETDAGRVELQGMWRYKVGLNARDAGGFPRPPAYAIPAGRPFRGPAVLYNAMIHPLTRLGVKGAIWYQGESNSGRGDEYRDLFPTMIASWREAWSEARGVDVELPFYFVQLPNYRQRRSEPVESSWAEIREAQRLTMDRVPATGMAITIDIGDPGDIHPTNKLPVAERLARQALVDVYGASITPRTGPLPKAARLDTRGDIRVTFSEAPGLTTADGASGVLGFALQDASGDWAWADALIERGAQEPAVIISSSTIDRPVAVRYAWGDNPAVNLVNEAGLPASPFQLTIGSDE